MLDNNMTMLDINTIMLMTLLLCSMYVTCSSVSNYRPRMQMAGRPALDNSLAVHMCMAAGVNCQMGQVPAPKGPHLHEFIMQHCVWRGTGRIQEFFQALARSVVHTICAQNVQLFQAEVWLHSTQRLHLSSSLRSAMHTLQASSARPGSMMIVSADQRSDQAPPTAHITLESQLRLPAEHHALGGACSRTWQPTPMKSNFFTFKASTVASVFRFGERVGLTPLAFMMSATERATNCNTLHTSTC